MVTLFGESQADHLGIRELRQSNSLFLCLKRAGLYGSVKPRVKPRMKATVNEALTLKNPPLMYQKTFHWN